MFAEYETIPNKLKAVMLTQETIDFIIKNIKHFSFNKMQQKMIYRNKDTVIEAKMYDYILIDSLNCVYVVPHDEFIVKYKKV